MKYFNLDGIVGDFENQNEYSGLNESKLGFNATVTEYIGEFDIVLNSFACNLYKKTNKDKSLSFFYTKKKTRKSL